MIGAGVAGAVPGGAVAPPALPIAFYAPLKPPTHPTPSGDRTMARLLGQALETAGYRVELAARLRSFDGRGDVERQRRIRTLGRALAERLLARYRTRPRHARPACWFTYHLYHKAPDWIGPEVCRALDIPYVVAEASHAPKRAAGPWALGLEGAAAALAAARVVVALNPSDVACLAPVLSAGARIERLRPFLDLEGRPRLRRRDARRAIARCLPGLGGVDPDVPWLVTVAMMRPGDKLASYRVLGAALARLGERPWRLVVVGDGAARRAAHDALAPVASRVVYAGARDGEWVWRALRASDLFVWPAVNEAYGMALLEAQAAGVPVVAGCSEGVAQIVADGATGLLVRAGDAGAFAAGVARLLDAPAVRRSMARRARIASVREHSVAAAAGRLRAILEPLLTCGAGRARAAR